MQGEHSRSLAPILLWVLVSALLIGSHYSVLFHEPRYEESDLAANALQIRDAKKGQEIYGNYSRFKFHHPGPAFFYVYAAGEAVFYDLLRVVPAPNNAHAVAGILVQGLFFSWAVSIVAQRTRSRLVVPLLLVFAAIHFGQVNSLHPGAAFYSIWPPAVLLMPFFCMLVAGASLASGSTRHLVPLVAAACFLAHGHVAQPLFVLPLVGVSYAAWWWTNRGRSLAFRDALAASARPHIAAVLIVAIFLLPIVLDALKGQQSNLALIVNHFLSHSADGKTLTQSVLYLMTFVCRVQYSQTYCDVLTTQSFEFLRARWYYLAAWGVLLAGTAALLIRLHRRDRLSDPAFAAWLCVHTAVATALTLVWGMLQNGPMYAFNGFFNFAILFVPLVLLAIGVAALPPPSAQRVVTGALFILAVPMLVFASRNMSFGPAVPMHLTSGPELQQQIQRAAAEDPNLSRTKLLWFKHGDWPDAARVAIALERDGYRPRVPADWAFMFEQKRATDLVRGIRNHKIAVWQVRSAASGSTWLLNAPAEVDPNGTDIWFSGPTPNAREFIAYGWDIASGPYSRTTGTSALLRFRPRPTLADVEIACEIIPLTEGRSVAMSFNNGPTQSYDVTQPTRAVIRIPRDQWLARAESVLKFTFTDTPVSTADTSAGSPERALGFVRIRFQQAAETNTNSSE